MVGVVGGVNVGMDGSGIDGVVVGIEGDVVEGENAVEFDNELFDRVDV